MKPQTRGFGAALLLLLLVACAHAQPRVAPGRGAKKTCGGTGQKCCPNCFDIPDGTECDTYSCDGDNQCYTFADQQRGAPPDGTANFPQICLQTPKNCGKAGQPCCYNPDPSSAQQCLNGLTCVINSTIYASYAMYQRLAANHSAVADPRLMGTCRKLTQADCGTMWGPCGGAAKALKCPAGKQGCPKGAYCASPGDTRLGAPRCFPLPANCGKLDGPCCPANARAKPVLSVMDNKTAVPFCTDPKAMCMWQYDDYAEHGTKTFPLADPTAPSTGFPWDGSFERGYGRSRCVPAPTNGTCGAPGQSCCPSFIDRQYSGTVINKIYPYQPCNYRSAKDPRAGIYCKGEWQGGLIKKGVKLGVCTLNPSGCGKAVGKPCCLSEVPGVAQLGQCMSSAPPGSYYCTQRTNLCTRCPTGKAAANATAYVRRNCQAFS